MMINLVKFKITVNGSFCIFAFKIYNKEGYKKPKMNMIKNRRSLKKNLTQKGDEIVA